VAGAAVSDHNTATIRTFVNNIVAMVVVLVASHLLDREVSINEGWVLLVVPAVVTIVHRFSLVISEKVPWVGYVLFGVNRSPAYTEPPPALPALADDPPPAA
jgi:hypothetical protein